MSLSIAKRYAAWSFARSFLHRGWWLATSLYLVIEAHLSPLELVLLGTAQGLTVLAAELPTGIVADTCSRKWSLVIAHILMGLGMLATGLVTSFPALALTQMLWGLSWTFSTGADVAWLTDEMDAPAETPQALVRAARWGYAGAALGILTLGGWAWLTSLSMTMVMAGAAMLALGVIVAFAFPEKHFKRPPAGPGFRVAVQTFTSALDRVRLIRVLVLILVCTFLVNGADEVYGRLESRRLVDLGLPDLFEPIAWLTLLAVITLSLSVTALARISALLDRGRGHPDLYILGAAAGVVGLAVFAMAPNAVVAMAGVLMVRGIAMPVMRTISEIWANHHATREIRATVQSMLSLAEYLGEITLGFLLALVAQYLGIEVAMGGACMSLLVVLLLVRKK